MVPHGVEEKVEGDAKKKLKSSGSLLPTQLLLILYCVLLFYEYIRRYLYKPGHRNEVSAALQASSEDRVFPASGFWFFKALFGSSYSQGRLSLNEVV